MLLGKLDFYNAISNPRDNFLYINPMYFDCIDSFRQKPEEDADHPRLQKNQTH